MSVIPVSLSARVGGLFASHFLGYGLFLPFFPMVLEARELSVSQIGLILGIGTFVRIAANPLMTGLSDHSGRRRLSIFVYSVAGALFLGFFSASSGFLTALISVAGLLTFWSPIVPLTDAYALDVVRNHGADYGRMRLWGSAAFVVANVAGGWFAGSEHFAPLIVVAMALAVLSTGGVAMSLPGQKSVAPEGDKEADGRPRLFAQPWFWLVLAVLGLLQGSHAAFYGFGTLFWLKAEISEFQIGLLWSVGVVAEIALFFVAGRLGARFGPLNLMMLGAVVAVIRWSLFPFADSFALAACLQVLHSFSFGAAHLGTVGYLAGLVPQKWSATGQGFLAASNGILTAAGFAVCGGLFDLDPAYAFWAMAGMAAIAVVALTLLRSFMAGKLLVQQPEPV